LLWLSGYGNTYVVKGFFTTTDVARFTFAYTLASLMQLVASSMNQVWSPRFFRLVHELPVSEVERRSRQFFALEGAVLGLIGGTVLALIPIATRVAGQSLQSYQGMSLEFFLMFAAYAVSIPWFHVQNYYYVHGQGVGLMRVTLATSILGLVGWLGAMWLLGVIGIYAGFAVMTAIRSVGATAYARTRWPVAVLYEGPCVALLLLAAGAFLPLLVARAYS
jgi:O-antigen/teichoic acid export membrane protein